MIALPAPKIAGYLPAVCPVVRRVPTPCGLVNRAMLGGCTLAITTRAGTFAVLGDGLIGEALAQIEQTACVQLALPLREAA